MANVAFKGQKISLSGELPAIGAPAIDFQLVRGDLSEATLATYQGKKKIFNIVPSLDTGVCATSAKKFNEKLSADDKIVVINVSMDLPFAQGRFCKSEGIHNSEALSAFRSSFPADYGVVIQEGPLKGLCARSVVVVDENDQVIYTELVPEITSEPDYDKVLEVLQAGR